MAAPFLIYCTLSIVMASFIVYATDPNMLQDFCVATNDPNNTLFVNGLVCKNPSEVTEDDFFFRNINTTMYNFERLGLRGSLVTASNLPGLNTMGISLSQVDHAPNPKGLSPPHFHPRSTELLVVLSGTLCAGFISGANKLYSKILNPGDVFVFPQGLVHFHFNTEKTNSVTISAFHSQNPGFAMLGENIFGSDPPISIDVLSKGFQLDQNIVEELQSKF